MTTETRLTDARTRLASLDGRLREDERRDADRHWTQRDTASYTGNGTGRESTRSYSRRQARYSRESALVEQRDAARDTVSMLERALAAERFEAVREHFDAETLSGASLVRDRFGWHKVAKVNCTTVSVETGYSWTDRVAFDKILGAVCLIQSA